MCPGGGWSEIGYRIVTVINKRCMYENNNPAQLRYFRDQGDRQLRRTHGRGAERNLADGLGAGNLGQLVGGGLSNDEDPARRIPKLSDFLTTGNSRAIDHTWNWACYKVTPTPAKVDSSLDGETLSSGRQFIKLLLQPSRHGLGAEILCVRVLSLTANRRPQAWIAYERE